MKMILRTLLLGALAFLSSLALASTDNVTEDPKLHIHNYTLVYAKKRPLMTKVQATWTVPEMPTNIGQQFLSIWDGLLSEDNSVIVQPVLQFGHTNAAGKKEWELSCWTVTHGTNHNFRTERTPPVYVDPGTEVTGIVELISTQGGLYTYKCYFAGYPQSEQTYTTKAPLNSAWLDYETVEVTSCDHYTEGFATFKNIQVLSGRKPVGIPWYHGNSAIGDQGKCGVKLKILKDSTKNGVVQIGVPAKTMLPTIHPKAAPPVVKRAPRDAKAPKPRGIEI